MYRFFESIAIVGGVARNLPLHQERVEKTYRQFYKVRFPVELSSLIQQSGEQFSAEVKYKFKFSYSQNKFSLSFELYETKAHAHFKLIPSKINYPHKLTNRIKILQLKKDIADQDEIIIIRSNRLTDTSYSNLVFSDGRSWFTPKQPLLKGIMRTHLLNQNKITEEDLCLNDLHKFVRFKCINALNGLEEGPVYGIEKILHPNMIQNGK
ncbi:MAG: aminotransferase class IV [Saprospiraceae bacterium]|nr:aminotransferase class IV [Saprospiraceae bacterium]